MTKTILNAHKIKDKGTTKNAPVVIKVKCEKIMTVALHFDLVISMIYFYKLFFHAEHYNQSQISFASMNALANQKCLD